MKKILFTTISYFALNCLAANGRSMTVPKPYNDTSVLVQIMALPLNTFIGKPVDSLFTVLPSNYTNRRFLPAGNSKAKGVYQSYGTSESNSVSVEIFIDSWQYVTFPSPPSPPSALSMNSAKSETIAHIRIIKNNACIFGCANLKYY